MQRYVFLAVAAIAAVGLATGSAQAQCAFEHPRKAKKFQASLVQAFTGCETDYANTATEGGLASCKPPETWNEQYGSPPDGWLWDETRGRGTVSFTAAKVTKFIQVGTALPGANPASPFNPVGDVVDLVVQMKLGGVISNLPVLLVKREPGGS